MARNNGSSDKPNIKKGFVMSDRETQLKAILERFKGIDADTQRTRLIFAMRELGSITTFEAIRFLDCYDPRPRIWELRHLFGHKIKTHMRAEQTESGVFHRIGVYFLESEGVNKT